MVEINNEYDLNLSRKHVSTRLNDASIFGRMTNDTTRRKILRLYFDKANNDKDP